MKFTNNWFEITAKKHFEKYLIGRNGTDFLEIGCYEGRATLWLLENIPNSKLTVIDTFNGSIEHKEIGNLYGRFVENILLYKDRVRVRVGESQILLREMKEEFDFIYVDGSHLSTDVLEDAILSFRLLKKGGIMILDDYNWNEFENPLYNPRMGIDAFLNIFKEKFNLLEVSNQAILEKL